MHDLRLRTRRDAHRRRGHARAEPAPPGSGTRTRRRPRLSLGRRRTAQPRCARVAARRRARRRRRAPSASSRSSRTSSARNDASPRATGSTSRERGIFALNLVSSPGSGKTTLLVRTIDALKATHADRGVEGDQQTSLDADRIRATGAPAVQVNTGKGCHLDARHGRARARDARARRRRASC